MIRLGLADNQTNTDLSNLVAATHVNGIGSAALNVSIDSLFARSHSLTVPSFEADTALKGQQSCDSDSSSGAIAYRSDDWGRKEHAFTA
jgi:hypothetical protein